MMAFGKNGTRSARDGMPQIFYRGPSWHEQGYHMMNTIQYDNPKKNTAFGHTFGILWAPRRFQCVRLEINCTINGHLLKSLGAVRVLIGSRTVGTDSNNSISNNQTPAL